VVAVKSVRRHRALLQDPHASGGGGGGGASFPAAATSVLIESLKEEASLLLRFPYDNVIRLRGVALSRARGKWDDDDRIYIVMDWMNLKSLSRLLRNGSSKEEPFRLDLARAVRAWVAACGVMSLSHERDVSLLPNCS
jgi:serine/threonine protein kinase